jgi:hypothetical protein
MSVILKLYYLNKFVQNMKIFISQPTFFPWLGYFDMINQVDKFIILDDVDYSHQSWQNRNNFKTPDGLKLFTIPTSSSNESKLINDIKIKNVEFVKKKFKKFILSNYSKSRFFNHYKEEFYSVIDTAFSQNNLLHLNFEFIKWIIEILDLKVELNLSSKLKLQTNNIKKILDICNYFNADEYLTTAGSKIYLSGNENLFQKNNIKLRYHNYKHPKYVQLFGPFIEYACILDLLFNEGGKSLSIIKSGRLTN